MRELVKVNVTNVTKSCTIKPLKVCRLFLVLLEEISRLIQDVTILWDEEVSVPLVNLQLLPVTVEVVAS